MTLNNMLQHGKSICQNENQDQLNISQPILEGWWNFEENFGNAISDLSGSNNALVATGNPRWCHKERLAGSVALDGATQWLSTDKSVLYTDKSFSIAAWVRLDSAILNGKLVLKTGENALTAVSQDSLTHSGFYLGARRFEELQPDGTITAVLNWSFTLAPVNMKDNGVHARSKVLLNDSILDKWVMLIGVCDVEKRVAHIYLPDINELSTAYMPDIWTCWQAKGGFQVGRGHWLKKNVDQWPGSIGSVRVFSGVLSMEDAKKLYDEDTLIR